jgi:hypothetical protein
MKRLVKVLSVSLVLAASAITSYAGCMQRYIQQVDSCSNLEGWVDRSACGLDAATEYAGCVRRTIMG